MNGARARGGLESGAAVLSDPVQRAPLRAPLDLATLGCGETRTFPLSLAPLDMVTSPPSEVSDEGFFSARSSSGSGTRMTPSYTLTTLAETRTATGPLTDETMFGFGSGHICHTFRSDFLRTHPVDFVFE